MNIWSIVRQFNYRQLYLLSTIMLQNPLLIKPTLKATRETMTICNTVFKETHHKNGKTNAFRHAIWNVLICLESFKINKNEEKSIIWAQRVTDLHEKLAPNEPLEKAMDLHNNAIGRKYFVTLKENTKEEIITFFKEKTEKAKRVFDNRIMSNHINDLVYISDT